MKVKELIEELNCLNLEKEIRFENSEQEGDFPITTIILIKEKNNKKVKDEEHYRIVG